MVRVRKCKDVTFQIVDLYLNYHFITLRLRWLWKKKDVTPARLGTSSPGTTLWTTTDTNGRPYLAAPEARDGRLDEGRVSPSRPAGHPRDTGRVGVTTETEARRGLSGTLSTQRTQWRDSTRPSREGPLPRDHPCVGVRHMRTHRLPLPGVPPEHEPLSRRSDERVTLTLRGVSYPETVGCVSCLGVPTESEFGTPTYFSTEKLDEDCTLNTTLSKLK